MMKTNCAFQIKMLTLRFTGDGALDSVPATALLIRGMPEVLRVRVDAEHRELEVLYQDSTDNNDLGWTILRNTLPEDYKITDVNEN